jgi:hypothetical protein
VLGLALGMACCIFIFLIVQFELSFDRFHSKRSAPRCKAWCCCYGSIEI